MFTLAVSLVLVVLGTAGIRYAPAVVAAQHRQGMAPLEDDDHGVLDETDRKRATRGTGVVFVVVGFALLAYGSGAI
ncbi:hypothetical protein [Natronorubrum halophilum]|uniref:hypothetical protein n=1 Tax=Natronorubrum halophilum TaxID=1702106 RepID=UPI000EF6499B|nr:hypothetical protein [Natronorubrum halophilum]